MTHKFIVSSKVFAYSGAYILGCPSPTQPYVGHFSINIDVPDELLQKYPRDVLDNALLKYLETYSMMEYKDRIDSLLSYYKLDKVYFDDGKCVCVDEIDENDIISQITITSTQTNLRG